jgi:hypothetical protein
MQREPNQGDEIEQHFTQELLRQAAKTPELTATLRHEHRTLYVRFASAYRELLALSRAQRRKCPAV